MRGRLRSGLLIVWLVAASAVVHAQSVSYTVQVVALSDQEAALDVQSDLIRDGFPAYVVGSRSEQGDVFRVRVGAFANRAAALLYASGMPQVGGVQPVPALAESIPAGIMPLAPMVLLDESLVGREVAVGTFDDQMIIRLRSVHGSGAEGSTARDPTATTPDGAEAVAPSSAAAWAAQQPEFVIVQGSVVLRRRAWRFGEVDGAHLWVRDTLLWPATWQDETDEVRAGFRASLLRLLAERLGVEVADVEAASYQPDADGPPLLIVVELAAPDQPDGVRLLGLGLPAGGFDAHGPLEYLGITREELPPLLVDVTVDELLAEPQVIIEGEGFTATSDDGFIRLTAGTLSWRAGLGTPLWSGGQRLLAVVDDRVLVYGFVER